MAFFEGNLMTAGYGDGPDIINSCTINVNRGEIVAILGPNGAGKSTAMKAMLGLLDLKAGSVSIDGKSTLLNANNIVVATGARANELPTMQTDGKLIWNYKHALRPSRMPGKLLVVGSGAIGVEFASFFNTLGVDTTLVDIADRILPQEDIEIVEVAKKHFENRGISIYEKAFVKELKKSKTKVSVKLNIRGVDQVCEFDTIISATGIVGNIENLGLEELSIKTSKSHIVTDSFCRTNQKNIFAIGDVAGPPWLAHKASHEGVLVAEKIAQLEVDPIKIDEIPSCTFSTPQIASIGLSEKEAQKKGYNIKVGKFPFLANGKALAIGETGGLIKTVCDSETGEILGAHLIGAEVTELIHSYALGKQLEGTDQDFIETVFPHPTLSEMIHESALGISNRTIHF